MRFLFAFLAFLTCLPAFALGLERAPIPDWVDDLPIPAVDPALQERAVDGVHYIVSDHQIQWDGADQHSYGRTVLQVTDRAGLEQAATISFDFDPKLDRIILTRLMIIRDGREIDLRDSVREEVLRREQRLDEGIIDGTLTAWLQVPDLRVGDMVDYSSIRVMKPLVPGGERSSFSTLEWGVPVQLSRTVVLWPEDWTMLAAPLPDRVVHVESPVPGKGVIRHEWQRLGHIPERWEDNIPPGYEPEAVLRFTAEADWGFLSAALTPHYAADYPLTPDWEGKVAAIAATNFTPEHRAIAALRLVQDELRYVSISVAAGGYFARLPAEVIASGFGDCKDKSLLLTAILRRLGVNATVALTDIDAGHALPMDVPMPGVFDHAIVRIRLDGQSHWVDPTASHQGGDFASAAPPDYGWALPLTGAGQTALEPIAVTPEQAWSTDVTESYTFSAVGVLLEVTSVYGGGAADSMRQRWATTHVSDISYDYFQYYQGRYPGLTMMRDMEKRDDRAANRFEMVERYLLPQDQLGGTDLEVNFPFSAEDFASNLPDRLTAPRRSPLAVGPAAVFRHHVRVRKAPIEFTAPEAVQIDNPGFSFEMKAETSGPGSLDLIWQYRRSGLPVAADKAAGVIADGDRVYDLTWFTWDLRPELPQ